MDSSVKFIQPPAPRHRLVSLPDGVAIHIPAKRSIVAILFLSLWLCGWAAGAVSAIRELLNPAGDGPAAGGFLAIWLIGWTAGGAFALLIVLWQLGGREIVSVSGMMLRVRYETLGLGFNRQYNLSQVRFMRLAPLAYSANNFRNANAFWGLGGGPIAFDYGSRTYRFAAGPEEAEARVVLEALVERSPLLAESLTK